VRCGAEGLLAFLPSDAQDRLLDNVTALSAPDSWLVCENMSGRDGAAVAVEDRLHNAVENWRKHGFDVEMTDLWYSDDRHDVADYLSDRGWTTTETTMANLFVSDRSVNRWRKPPPYPVGRVRLGMMTSSTRACTVRRVGGRLGMMDLNMR
jgi:O-methyltransferase involved in polyketide biosynthesis